MRFRRRAGSGWVFRFRENLLEKNRRIARIIVARSFRYPLDAQRHLHRPSAGHPLTGSVLPVRVSILIFSLPR